MDGSHAVFKTVCGALLRRPGWVRFPSIPAKFAADDSQHDSHSSVSMQTAMYAYGPAAAAPSGGRVGADSTIVQWTSATHPVAQACWSPSKGLVEAANRLWRHDSLSG